MKIYHTTGIDAHGVPRVYTTGPDQQTCMDDCWIEAATYVHTRPDTGPLLKWRFEVSEYEEVGS